LVIIQENSYLYHTDLNKDQTLPVALTYGFSMQKYFKQLVV